jgi:O-antigen/teichoic acid export membrane protein
MPVVITTSGLRGVLEARQRFDLINWLRIPLGVFLLAGPLLVLPFSQSLFPVVLVLVGVRLVSWTGHLLLCFRVMPELRRHMHLQHAAVKPLLVYGGWMTVTNVVGPLMVTFDRFVIGVAASVAAVAYYATPFEVITKLWVVPSALMAVIFPAFSSSFVQNSDRTGLLFWRALKFVFIVLFPVTLLAVAFAGYGLTLWLGPDFAEHSAPILRWLAIGVFINSLAQVPCVLVQGTGRPDLAAKLHFLELPAYLFLLWWLIRARGVEGAAIAWTLRIVVDAAVMFLFALRILPESRSLLRRALVPVGFAFLIFGLATIPGGLASKGIFSLLTLVIYGPTIWYVALSSEERALLLQSLRLSQLESPR